MAVITGQSGLVKIDLQNLNVLKWSFNPTVGMDETTNTGSAGFYEGIPTIKTATGSFDCKWDSAANPHLDPPGIILGAVVALKLYVGDSTSFYDIPTAYIVGVPVANDAKAAITFSCNFQVTAGWTDPA